MATTPTLSRPRDILVHRIDLAMHHVRQAVDQSARQGFPGCEEDLQAIWMELMRVQSSICLLGYSRRRGRPV